MAAPFKRACVAETPRATALHRVPSFTCRFLTKTLAFENMKLFLQPRLAGKQIASNRAANQLVIFMPVNYFQLFQLYSSTTVYYFETFRRTSMTKLRLRMEPSPALPGSCGVMVTCRALDNVMFSRESKGISNLGRVFIRMEKRKKTKKDAYSL